MEPRKFNNYMPIVHERYVARVLNMEHNPGIGPDVIDELKIVEVKFSLIKPKGSEKDYPCSWTVLDHQTRYLKNKDFRGKIGFWVLGLYELDRPVNEIETTDHNELEDMVTSREMYLIKWDFMKQFKPSRCRGEKTTKWDNTFRYPKLSLIPKTEKTYHVEKGLLHLTCGVSEEYFTIDSQDHKTDLVDVPF